MEGELRNFSWSLPDLVDAETETDSFVRGRVSVLYRDNIIAVRQLDWHTPPAQILPAVIYSMNLVAQAVRLYHRQTDPFFIQTWKRPHGAVDYLLRISQSAEFVDAPIADRLHIEVRDKLGQGFHAWLGSVPPLLEAAGLWPPTKDHVKRVQLVQIPVCEETWKTPVLRTRLAPQQVGGKSVAILDDEATGFIVAIEVEGRRAEVGVPFRLAELRLSNSSFTELKEMIREWNLNIRCLGNDERVIEDYPRTHTHKKEAS